MGQVFTWKSIAAWRIPNKAGFAQITQDLRNSLSLEPSIVTALMFGSIVRGDFNVRSDVDCVVVYKTDQELWAMKAMQEICRSARLLHIPMNFTPCDTVLAKTRLHHLGISFIEHLESAVASGGLIKGTLVGGLLAPTMPPKQEIESYIKMKMFSLQSGLVMMSVFNDDELVRFLRKAFEAPMHIARKLLIYDGVIYGDSKRQVQNRFRETMPSALSTQLDYLVEVDSAYTVSLMSQGRRPNQEEYSEVIEHLTYKVPHVLSFIRACILYLTKKDSR